MTDYPLDVLDAQTDLRRRPLAYLVNPGAGAAGVADEELLESVLRAHVDPFSPKRVRTALMAMADPSLVLDALASGQLDGLLSERELSLLATEIRRARARQLATLHRQVSLARVRFDRLDPEATTVGWVDDRLHKALESIEKEAPTAAELEEAAGILENLSGDLDAAEARELTRLAKELERAVGATPPLPTDTAHAVRRALADHDVARARDVLRGALAAELPSSGDLPPFRNPITAAESPERLLAWITTDAAPGAPFGFRKLWAPAPEDAAGQALLASIVQLFNENVPLTTELFGDFVVAFERALGVPEEANTTRPLVSVQDGRIVARLRGLQGEGLYALEDVAYDRGVLIAFEPPVGRALSLPAELPAEAAHPDGALALPALSPAVRRDEDDDEDDDDPSEDVPSLATAGHQAGYWISLGTPPNSSAPGRPLILAWRTLLGVIGDLHRAHSLRRLIGPLAAPQEAFPDATRRRSTAAPLVGRARLIASMRENDGAALWVGPRGCGRTALLARLEADARTDGTAVHRLESATQVAKLERLLDSGSINTYTDTDAPRLLLTVDDLEELDGADESEGGAVRAVAVLQQLRNLHDPRVTAVCTSGIGLSARLGGAPWNRIPPLTFAESRVLIGRLLDITGGSLDAHGSDQLSYFAGGHPRLLHFALRQLRLSLPNPTGEWRAGRAEVQALLGRDDVQDGARDMLLASIDELPGSHAGVFAMTYDLCTRRRGAAVSAEQVSEALQTEWKISIGADDVRQALRCLHAAYVVDRTANGWTLPSGGLGWLLIDNDLQPRLEDWLVRADDNPTDAALAETRAE